MYNHCVKAQNISQRHRTSCHEGKQASCYLGHVRLSVPARERWWIYEEAPNLSAWQKSPPFLSTWFALREVDQKWLIRSHDTTDWADTLWHQVKTWQKPFTCVHAALFLLPDNTRSRHNYVPFPHEAELDNISFGWKWRTFHSPRVCVHSATFLCVVTVN